MWLIDVITDGFSGTIPVSNYGLFRILFGIACVIKVVVELRHHHHRFFDSDGFLRFLYSRRPHLVPVPELLYAATFPAKLVGALMLMGGFGVRLAAIMMAIAFLIEFTIYFKFHANLYFLLALAFAIDPPLSHRIVPMELPAGTDPRLGSGLGPASIVITMTMLYWGTAYRKMNRTFLSGGVVYQHLESVLADRERRHHRDGWYPPALVRFVLQGDERAVRRLLTPLMWLTVGLELAVPLLLLFPDTHAPAALLGIAMHAGFTFLFPEILLSFSMTSVSTYLLFADPRLVDFWIW